MSGGAENDSLDELLKEAHRLEIQGFLEDLRAPFKLMEEIGDDPLEMSTEQMELLKQAWGRHRAARPGLEACLKRNGISAAIQMDKAAEAARAAAQAGKIGMFRQMVGNLSLEQKRQRILGGSIDVVPVVSREVSTG